MEEKNKLYLIAIIGLVLITILFLFSIRSMRYFIGWILLMWIMITLTKKKIKKLEK